MVGRNTVMQTVISQLLPPILTSQVVPPATHGASGPSTYTTPLVLHGGSGPSTHIVSFTTLGGIGPSTMVPQVPPVMQVHHCKTHHHCCPISHQPGVKPSFHGTSQLSRLSSVNKWPYPPSKFLASHANQTSLKHFQVWRKGRGVPPKPHHDISSMVLLK